MLKTCYRVFLSDLTNAGAKIRMKSALDEHMPYRFTITVPDQIGDDLKKWADGEGRPTANLAAFLVEVAVKRKYPKKYPEISDSEQEK